MAYETNLGRVTGKSAYEIAVDNGYIGTEAEWLESLKGGGEGSVGADGKSAYEIAVENGYNGTEVEWLESLKGVDGQDGENGQDGQDGVPGTKGKSAYEIAVDNGYIGTEVEWLASLHGTDGQNGQDGTPGANGKSAYEIAVDNGYTGTEAEWLESLKGTGGGTGEDTLEEYQIANWLFYRKIGAHLVELFIRTNFTITIAANGVQELPGPLPAGYTPSREIYAPAVLSQKILGYIVINAKGQVFVYNKTTTASSSGNVYAHVVYAV